MTRRYILFAAMCVVVASCSGSDVEPDVSADAGPYDRFVEVNGAKLHYLDWGGQGPLLLLVHGFTNTAYTFGQLAPALTREYRVMAVTRRGHGASEPPPAAFDLDLNVDDLAAFIAAFSDEPAIVAGMSHGGLEIPRLARRYPELVSSLIFLDAVYDWRQLSTFPPLPGFAPDSLFPSYEQLDAWHRDAFAEFWSVEFHRHVHSQVYTRQDGQIAWQLSPNGFAHARYLALWTEWDPTDYQAIHVPVLAIRALQEDYLVANLTRRGFSVAEVDSARTWAKDFDDVAKSQGLELLVAANPEATVIELENTNHLLHLHRPRQVAEAMLQFLADRMGS